MRFLDRILNRTPQREPAWIEPDHLKRRLDAGESLLVVDVRGPEEFAGQLGHIGSAVNLPLPELPDRVARLAADPRPIVCVCLTDKRSWQAAAALAAAGHRDVRYCAAACNAGAIRAALYHDTRSYGMLAG